VFQIQVQITDKITWYWTGESFSEERKEARRYKNYRKAESEVVRISGMGVWPEGFGLVIVKV